MTYTLLSKIPSRSRNVFEPIQGLDARIPPLSSPQVGAPWIRRAAIARSLATCLQRLSIPLSGRAKTLHPIISHVLRRALKGFPGGSVVKNPPAMQEMQVQSLGWEDPREKGMATHCSIHAWRIPRTEEPSGLQCRESQRVGHN